MIRVILAALTLALTAVPALATDIQAMTDQERNAFRAEVRDYLVQNPEVLLEAIQVLQQRESQQAALADKKLVENNKDAIFSDGFSYVGGNPKGDVTLVEFMDYRCAFCRKAFPEVEQLIKSDGNIRFIVKEYPILGDASVLGSRFAIATRLVAGDAAYKNLHDALMTLRGDLNEAALKRVAKREGLDYDAIAAKMNDPEVDREIGLNHELAAKLQIQGTPTFVVGDAFIRGYAPLDQMQQMVTAIRNGAG